MKDVRFYNKPLSDADIAAIYACGAPSSKGCWQHLEGYQHLGAGHCGDNYLVNASAEDIPTLKECAQLCAEECEYISYSTEDNNKCSLYGWADQCTDSGSLLNAGSTTVNPGYTTFQKKVSSRGHFECI